MKILFSNHILIKRLVSRLIDLIIPTISVLIGYFSWSKIYEQTLFLNEINSILLISWFAYCTFIIVSISILKNRTYGDSVLKIKAIQMRTGKVSVMRLISREIYIAVIFLLAIKFTYGWLAIFLSLIPFGKSKSINTYLIAVDFIFNTKYISYNNVKA
jgi:hypothetical protein